MAIYQPKPASYQPKKGDTVKVSREVVVEATVPGGFNARDTDRTNGEKYVYFTKGTLQVELVKPTVTVFEPRNKVRRKAGGDIVLLGEDSYTYLSTGNAYKYGVGKFERSDFTSEYWERVTLRVED